jgi:hypothetical protein
VRWTGTVTPQYTQTYTFYAQADDTIRLWVNGQHLINDWTNGAVRERKGTIALTAGRAYDIRVDYSENTGDAVMRLLWSSASQAKQVIPTTRLAPPTNGLRGTYYNNADFTGTSVTRVDPTINFDWAANAPASGIAADTFSVRWVGKITSQHTQTHTFYTQADDRVRLWVNGSLLIDNWTNGYVRERSGTIALTAGVAYDIRIDYVESTGDAVMKLLWSSASQPKQVIPSSRFTSTT